MVAKATAGSAALRSIRQALEGGDDALSVGAPPSVRRLVVALRARGVVFSETNCKLLAGFTDADIACLLVINPGRPPGLAQARLGNPK